MKRKTFILKSFILSMALLVFIALALVGCGEAEGDPSTSSSSAGESSSTTDTSTSDSSGTTDSSTGGTDSSTGDPTGNCKHTGGTATCVAKAVCTSCGAEYGELGAHDEQYDVVAPTCILGGITNISCSNCDYTGTKDPTEALGHDEQYDVVEATCYESGITNVSCSRCDYTATKDPVDALGHDEQYDVVEATCNDSGITNISCSRCDYTATKDPVDALGHDYTSFVKKVEPTCSAGGYDIYKCVRCIETNEVADGSEPSGIHTLEYYKTVRPTCSVVGYKLYKCKTCDLTHKNPDLNTPNEPLPEDIVATVDHNYDYATVDGLVACFMCGKGYRDVTVEKVEGEDVFCFGCGKDPCECGATGEWGGYTPAKEPEALVANEKLTKTQVTLSSGDAALQIGGGLIVLTGDSETAYTVVIYAAADGAAVDTVEASGDYVLLFLDAYESVVKVEITATTDATVSFYVVE